MKKNTNTVEEGNEYVTVGVLKETLKEAFEEFAQSLAPVFEGFTKRLENRMDEIGRSMVTKKELLQMHDTFVSRSEFNSLNARVALVEEAVYE